MVRSSVAESSNTCFVSKILKLGTKRLNHASWDFPQTTPVPLRDRCRYAAQLKTNVHSRSFLVHVNNGLERIRIELALKDSP